MSENSGRKFEDLAEVRKVNAEAGHHWFDSSTLAWFRSNFPDGDLLRGGRFFITTEKQEEHARRSTVRVARPHGKIDNVGEFQQFAKISQARMAADMVARAEQNGEFWVNPDGIPIATITGEPVPGGWEGILVWLEGSK